MAQQALRRKQNRTWRHANPEKVREYQRKYTASHLDEIRRKSRLRMAVRLQTDREALYASAKLSRAKHKDAVAARNRRWYLANRDKVLAALAKDPEAHRERVRTWRLANKDKRNAYARRWAREHPAEQGLFDVRRRARKNNAPGRHTTAEWVALCWASGWVCVYCAAPLHVKTATRDHKVPLSRGGGDSIDNIVLACRSCNSRKHTLTDLEFIEGELNANQ